MSGHSFVFVCPSIYDAVDLINAKEFVQFLTCHTVVDNQGENVIGYVQFVFKRTEESLHASIPQLKWMKSINDVEVYSAFINPPACLTAPRTQGDPRPKTYVVSNGMFMLKSLKKKASEALTDRSKKLVIKASKSLLQNIGNIQ